MDYTPSRVERGQSSAIVRSFMAHHQGMNLLSLAHLMLERPMQRRFESDPQFKATLLLLQERIPKASAFHKHVAEHSDGGAFIDAPEKLAQAPIGANTPTPEVQLLSNGRYHVMVTNAGGGYSRWRDFAITRWREDSTCDNWGSFLYLRDAESGRFLVRRPPAHGRTARIPTKPCSRRVARSFAGATTTTRRIPRSSSRRKTTSSCAGCASRTIARVRRTIELTTYAEVVLAPPVADAIQPSFGKLFVQTEIIRARRAILCTRRPRSAGEHVPWSFQLLAARVPPTSPTFPTRPIACDSSAAGARSPAPLALDDDDALSGTEGSVLDPIVSIRCHVALEPGESATLDFVSGAGGSREACLGLIEKYQDRHLADRVFDVAWTHNNVMLAQINATAADAQLYRHLASSVLYGNAALRAESGVLMQNRRGQSGLWGYAISGDLPIVLVKIADASHIDLARQMIRCYTYWRLKGLVVDLVIWHEDHVSYRQRLQDQIMGLIATGIEASAIDRPGGIFVRSAEQISLEDRTLLQAVARVIISDSRGTLLEQVDRRGLADKSVSRLARHPLPPPEPAAAPEPSRPDLILGNHLGGFTPDGSEYVISTTQSRTDADALGQRARESELRNGRLRKRPRLHLERERARIPPDAVERRRGRRLRPEKPSTCATRKAGTSGRRRRCPSARSIAVRHAPRIWLHAYSSTRWAASTRNCGSTWTSKKPVKFSVLKVRNDSGRAATAVGDRLCRMGSRRPAVEVARCMSLRKSTRRAAPCLPAMPTTREFAGRIAFFDVDDLSRTLSGDRTEFIGRNGHARGSRGHEPFATFRTARCRARSLRRHPGSVRPR